MLAYATPSSTLPSRFAMRVVKTQSPRNPTARMISASEMIKLGILLPISLNFSMRAFLSSSSRTISPCCLHLRLAAHMLSPKTSRRIRWKRMTAMRLWKTEAANTMVRMPKIPLMRAAHGLVLGSEASRAFRLRYTD